MRAKFNVRKVMSRKYWINLVAGDEQEYFAIDDLPCLQPFIDKALLA